MKKLLHIHKYHSLCQNPSGFVNSLQTKVSVNNLSILGGGGGSSPGGGGGSGGKHLGSLMDTHSLTNNTPLQE